MLDRELVDNRAVAELCGHVQGCEAYDIHHAAVRDVTEQQRHNRCVPLGGSVVKRRPAVFVNRVHANVW